MFAPSEIKRLRNIQRLIWASMLAGFIVFVGAIAGVCYLCQKHLITYENKNDLTMYAYAGIAVGFAFLFAGLILLQVFRIVGKYIGK